jgi:adenylate cyclase
VCLVAFLAARTDFMIDFEYRGYDMLVDASADRPPDPRVAIVDFDDAAIARIGAYPIPRSAVARVIDRVAAGEPALIGLDLLLSESRTPDEDRALADAMQRAGNVVVASLHDSNQMLASEPLPDFCRPDPSIASACDERSAAFGVGMVNMPVDEDGFIRRFYVLPPAGYGVLPLPIALATNFTGSPLTPGPGTTLLLGGTRIRIDRTGNNTALIGTWSRQPAALVGALDLLDDRFDPRQFRNRIVLIGQSNGAAGDRHFTPLFRHSDGEGRRMLMPGTAVMAAALVSALDGTTVLPVTPALQWTLVALLVAVSIGGIVGLRPAAAVLLVLVVGGATYGASSLLYAHAHVWFPFVSGELALLVALPAGFGYRFVRERWLTSATEAERRQLMAIFSKYVSPEVAEEIWSRRSEIVLAGEEKAVTVMFTDIRSFTKKTAGKPSPEVLRWLNDYFSAMTEVTQQHGGFVNKFIGDGIMILFGMPLTRGPREDASSAVRAGLAMIERLKQFNAEHASDPHYPRDLHIGVGIHSGVVVAGNVGARDRLEYSAIGEAVNLASRLESATKELGAELVMSEATWALVRDSVETVRLGDVTIRGFDGTMTVYGAAAAAAGTA